MTLVKAGWTDDRSLRSVARMAAALNILSAVPDGFSVSTLRRLVVRGDAAATAHNILGSESLFRLGFVADLVALVIFVASAVLLYEVFKPASRRAALLFLVLMVMGTLSQALEAVHDLAALALLKAGAAASGLPSAQANELALVFLRLHVSTYQLALFFFGCSSLVMGFLILRATFVPRILGPLMMIDGLGFLTFSLAAFLAPSVATHIYPYIPFVTALVGEGALFLWLIVKGVNAERWREQAAA
jgi:uncharacterized protein DUF4386